MSENDRLVGATSLIRVIAAGVMMFYANAALSNDGFYQGAGSTLKLVKNLHLRVREERLLISPIIPNECYSVYADNKAITDGMKLRKNPKVSIGKRVACREDMTSIFYAKWRAAADYKVDVVKTQNNVLIGFPVDTWERYFTNADGDLEYLPAPGVVNFHTYVNNQEIAELELKKLKSANTASGGDELGYTWTASFESGKPYHLRTEYDFGTDSSNSFYEGREFLAGEKPWFLGAMSEPFPSERIIYFLTPINSWALPEPNKIRIEIRLPQQIPVIYFVPLEQKPSCVTSSSLHYQLTNQFPSHELSVSMPNTDLWSRDKLKPMRTLKEWHDWQNTIGGKSVKIGCDVIDELMKRASPDLDSQLRLFQCVSSCEE